ncbi:hypothetical protein Aduo_015966 [Ancylostoma duodenale]
MRPTDNCCVCGHGPMRIDHIYDHLRTQHQWSEEQIEQKKEEYKQKKGQHKKEAHAISDAKNDVGCIVCPGCRCTFSNNYDLAVHCGKYHRDHLSNQDYAIIKGEFPSMREFELWKESLETTTTTNFAKRCSKVSKDGRRHYYVSKHARGMGMEVDAEELGRVYGKSKRVHSHWPAFLKVVEQESGTVQYEGCVGHLGHVVNSATLRLSNSDEYEIINMLRMGLDAHSVLAKLRREKWDFNLPADKQARLCYVNLKDT